MSFDCLFLNDPKDTVATAMNNFRAASLVPIVTSQGKKVRDLSLRAHIPIHFKVNVNPLMDHEPIIKLGGTIGKTVARVADVSTSDPERTISVELPPGLPIHDANFLVSQELWERWGRDLAYPLKAIFESQYATRQGLFKLGKAVRALAPKTNIHLGDIETSAPLRERLFNAVEEKMIIGRTLVRIPKHGFLRLGCCEEKDYDLPIDKTKIDILIAAYRHSQSLAL